MNDKEVLFKEIGPVEFGSIKVAPGDTLVFRIPMKTSARPVTDFAELCKRHFPENKVIVIQEGIGVSVQHPQGALE